MGNSNGVITAPINPQSDVARVLGLPAKGGWYDTGYLCSNEHGKINMWSRMKPVRWPNNFRINFDNAEWWKAYDGSCGITLPEGLTSYTQIPPMYTEDLKNGWGYNPPDGEHYPFRMPDFEGYKHDATSPFHTFSVDEKVAENNGTLRAYLAASITEVDKTGPGSVRLDDIAATYSGGDGAMSLADYQYGIVVTDASGNIKGRVAGNGSDMGIMCSYSVVGLARGTYYAYPMLSAVVLEQMGMDLVNRYYPLPGVAPATFRVVSAEEARGITIILNCEIIYSGNTRTGISYNIKITNTNTTAGVTLTNNWIMMRFSTSAETDGLMAGEKQVKLPDITVAAGDVYVSEGSFTIESAYASRSYYLYLTLQSGDYTRKVYPLDTSGPQM